MTRLKVFSKQKLKTARKARCLTLRKAAELFKKEGLAINHSTLFQYENLSTSNTPNANDMPVICMIYERPMKYFYQDPNKQSKGQKSNGRK